LTSRLSVESATRVHEIEEYATSWTSITGTIWRSGSSSSASGGSRGWPRGG